MAYRRPRIVWTNPLQPPTQYINVLGPKLKMLLRAPSGIDGSTVLARSWTDEISGAKFVTDSGTPTLTQDSGNFSGKAVLRGNPTSRLASPQFKTNLINRGDGPEIFAVVRAVTQPTNAAVLILRDVSAANIASLEFRASGVIYSLGGVTFGSAFTDTTNVHLITGRMNAGIAVTSIDGVDVFTSAPGQAGAAADCVIAHVGHQTVGFDGFVGLAGFVQNAMSTAERAEFLRIARQEFGF